MMYFPWYTIMYCIFLCKCGKGDPEKPIKEPIDYAKLELKKKALLGSRWAIENSKHNTTVFHEFQLVDIAKVDIADMSIRIDFFLRQRWEAVGMTLPVGLLLPGDPNDTYIAADEYVLDSVWSPDSFIPNARDFRVLKSAVNGHSDVNIYANGTIVYKARMYADLGCSFTFEWYPLDIQICDLVFESQKYSSTQVAYEWEPGPSPVTALDGIILYQYDFSLPPMSTKGIHSRWGLDFPNVKITFKFERRLGNNIIQVFTPTTLVVTLSFFIFWLGLDAVPGRISLLVTCILTLVTMHGATKGSIPPVHYVKMMDIWMIGCMTFVFGAICEFVLIKYLKWRAEHKGEREEYLKKNWLPGTVFPSETRMVLQSKQTNVAIYNQHLQMLQPPPTGRPIWVKLDRISRYLFPLLFAMFNAAYWPVLLTGSGKQYEDVTGGPRQT